MKKKLSLILMLCFMVLGMAACGSDPTTADYFGMTYQQLQGNAQQDVFVLSGSSDLSWLPESALDAPGTEWTEDLAVKFVSAWTEAVDGLGTCQGFGEFSIDVAQDTMTVEQYVEFEGREVIVSYIYEYNYSDKKMELVDATADIVYTLGEKMERAVLNTLMGMGTVFCVLILISLIIYCFRIIPYLQNRKTAKKVVETTPDAVVSQIEQREEQQLTDDLELVAVISAAIAASTGTSTDAFVVRSIHRR